MHKALYNLYFTFLSKRYSAKDISTLNLKKNDAVIVISNTALGDTLLSTPAIKSLKKSFPYIKVVAIFKKAFSILFYNFKYIDEIIEYDGNYKNFFSTIKKIKKYNPKLALIFHSNGPQDIQLCVLSGCKYILKHPTKSNLKHFLSYDFIKKNQHTIEDRLDLIRIIGGKNIDTTMEISQLQNLKLEKKFKQYKNFIGLQIGAADVYKMWPIENFIEIVKYLIKQGKKIVITGIDKEKKLGEMIVKECGENIINMCGKTPINELPYLIKNLKLLITNDTGTMHLSIALKIPTISLFAATNPKGIGPYQDSNIHKVVYKDGSFIQKLPKKQRDDTAMRLINTGKVIKAYKELNENLSL